MKKKIACEHQGYARTSDGRFADCCHPDVDDDWPVCGYLKHEKDCPRFEVPQ